MPRSPAPLRTIFLLAALSFVFANVTVAQEPAKPSTPTPTPPPNPSEASPSTDAPATPGEPEANPEQRRGRGTRRRGRRGGDDEAAQDAASDAKKKKPSRPKKPRRGIPVTEPLVQQHCATCHVANDDGHMTRISYMRKSPEGWQQTIKRMIRHHELELTPEEAKKIVRYLANDHGLTRSEAGRALYEAERRVHWSEQQHDKDMLRSCGACHTLGRFLSQQRDAQEWKQLKAMHLAFFPIARGQFRSRGGRRGGSGGGGDNIDWSSLSDAERERMMEERRRARRNQQDNRRQDSRQAREGPRIVHAGVGSVDRQPS